MSAGEDLYLLVLSELRRLAGELQEELGQAVSSRAPWAHVPPRLQALFEDWATLMEEP